MDHREDESVPMGNGARQPPWSVVYHDGNGNGFRIWQETSPDGVQFEYSPVKPETSSSGLYDGGEPRAGELDAARAEELWRHVAKLESDPSLREERRVKGSGALRVTTPDGENEFLVRSGPELDAFEAFLTSLE